MKIKSVIASIDDAPQSLRELYKQDGDHFVLNVEGIENAPQIAPLRNAHDRVVADGAELARQKAELESKLPDGATAEEFARLQKFEQEHDPAAEILAQKDSEIARKSKQIDSIKLHIALRDALTAEGVRPNVMDAAFALLESQAELDHESVYIRTRYGRTPVGRYVHNWATAGEGVSFVDRARVQKKGPVQFGTPAASAPSSTPATFVDLIHAIGGK